MKDFVIAMDCGCKVTYFAKSDLRSSRMECCTAHNKADQADIRTRMRRAADRVKMRKFDSLPVLPWGGDFFKSGN